MTFQIRVIAIADNGQEQVHEIPSLQRTELKPETLGLTLAEGKSILREIQRVVVEQQTAHCVAAYRHCSACERSRNSKGHHDLALWTVFGNITIPSPRFLQCDCQPHETKSFIPLAQLLPERNTPVGIPLPVENSLVAVAIIPLPVESRYSVTCRNSFTSRILWFRSKLIARSP
jgi:hypothetical protein